MKITISPLIIATLFVTLFASCNTGNKVTSSFGKRKYTKGYYFASAGKNKSAIPIQTEEKANRVSNNISNTGIQEPGIAANDKKTTIASQSISVPITKYKKAFQALPKTIGVSAFGKKNLENVFPDPVDAGHNATTNADSRKYGHFVTLSWVFLLLSILVTILLFTIATYIGIVAGILIAFFLSLASIILGGTAYHHGKEVPTIALSFVICILQAIALLLLIAFILLFSEVG